MKTLTVDQIRMMAERMKEADRALFFALLLCGAGARGWTWENAWSQATDAIDLWYDGKKN